MDTANLERPTSADGAMDDVSQGPSITLSLMPQQQGEVRSAADDWTGIVDRGERRRLQNRLNQRAYRKRESKKRVKKPKDSKRTKSTAKTEPNPGKLDTDSSDSMSLSSYGDSPTATKRGESVGTTSSTSSKSLAPVRRLPPTTETSLCKMTSKEMFNLAEDFENWAHQAYLMGSPDIDNLISLVQFNVFRAFLGNCNAIGFDSSWFADETIISPFYEHNLKDSTQYMQGPVNLRPTKLQQTVDHHPWIDLFPYPRLRDNILEQGDDYDDTPLCLDVVEFSHSSRATGAGLIVWGDPWDPNSWEVSKEFAQNWSWLIRGCKELFQSTNYWRRKRGERPLFPETLINKTAGVEEYDGKDG